MMARILPMNFILGKKETVSILVFLVVMFCIIMIYSVPIFFLNEPSGHLLTIFEFKDTDVDWYWGSTMDKYGVINVKSLFGLVSPALNSIEACVNAYIDFLGDSCTLASYEVNPWNYCGYRTIYR